MAADANDQIAKENYDRFCRWSLILAKFALKLALREREELCKKAAELRERVLQASDPAKAMRETMEKVERNAKDQIEDMRIQGCIDFDQARELKAQITEMSKYYDLDDGCVRAATIEKFQEHCMDLSDKFTKTHDKELCRDLANDAREYAKLPRAIYMDEEKLPSSLRSLKADIGIKKEIKAMEHAITQKRIKDGLDELVR